MVRPVEPDKFKAATVIPNFDPSPTIFDILLSEIIGSHPTTAIPPLETSDISLLMMVLLSPKITMPFNPPIILLLLTWVLFAV